MIKRKYKIKTFFMSMYMIVDGLTIYIFHRSQVLVRFNFLTVMYIKTNIKQFHYLYFMGLSPEFVLSQCYFSLFSKYSMLIY